MNSTIFLYQKVGCSHLVRITRFELAQPFGHKNLNLTRLPIPPYPLNMEKYFVVTILSKYDFLVNEYQNVFSNYL